MSGERTSKAQIIVVDDVSSNLRLMEHILSSYGYGVRPFTRGASALASAETNPPDLFLVDVMMPGMDGYEFCKLLKADANLASIPVIFLSGLNEATDKVRAFEVGGVDYLTKPLSVEEVVARVDTHLKLRRLGQELAIHHLRLDEQVKLRTRELEEANRRLSVLDNSKCDFLASISHELRTPHGGMFGIAESLFADLPRDPETDELKHMFMASRGRLTALMDDALLLTELDVTAEGFGHTTYPLEQLLASAMKDALTLCSTRGVSIGPVATGLPTVSGDEKLLKKALCALLTTAAQFSDAGGTILMSSEAGQARVVLSIEAHGSCIPDGSLPEFFEVRGTGRTITPGGDLGLRVSMAARVLQLFGGRVTVENLDPPGIRFHVCLQTAT